MPPMDGNRKKPYNTILESRYDITAILSNAYYLNVLQFLSPAKSCKSRTFAMPTHAPSEQSAPSSGLKSPSISIFYDGKSGVYVCNIYKEFM